VPIGAPCWEDDSPESLFSADQPHSSTQCQQHLGSILLAHFASFSTQLHPPVVEPLLVWRNFYQSRFKWKTMDMIGTSMRNHSIYNNQNIWCFWYLRESKKTVAFSYFHPSIRPSVRPSIHPPNPNSSTHQPIILYYIYYICIYT
jgi:hypothetical protein